jgi:hypothetical protein
MYMYCMYTVPYCGLVEGTDEGNAHGVHIAEPVEGRRDGLRGGRVRGSSPHNGLSHETLGGVGRGGPGFGSRGRNRALQMRRGSLERKNLRK